MNGFFIAGTDTGVGKTYVSCVLLHQLGQQSTALGMKPIASGSQQTPQGLRNEDALLLQQHSSKPIDYPLINPYAFAEPIAPHIAAAHDNTNIQIDHIVQQAQQLAQQTDYLIVEGVGGWMVPINETQTMETLAIALQLPVIFVVGLRLGCLNHALLSQQAILQHLPIAGWVANQIDPEFAYLADNLQTLKQQFQAPFLGLLPHTSEPITSANKLDLKHLQHSNHKASIQST